MPENPKLTERINSFLETGLAECLTHGSHPEWKFDPARKSKDGVYRVFFCKICNRENAAAWRKKNAGYMKDIYQTVSHRAYHLEWSARKRAETIGIPFEIDRAWIERQFQNQNGRCAYTGYEFDLSPWKDGGGLQNPYGPSLDRYDPKLGYTESNTRLVLWGVNLMKGRHSFDYFATLCKGIVRNL